MIILPAFTTGLPYYFVADPSGSIVRVIYPAGDHHLRRTEAD